MFCFPFLICTPLRLMIHLIFWTTPMWYCNQHITSQPSEREILTRLVDPCTIMTNFLIIQFLRYFFSYLPNIAPSPIMTNFLASWLLPAGVSAIFFLCKNEPIWLNLETSSRKVDHMVGESLKQSELKESILSLIFSLESKHLWQHQS